MRYDEAGFVGLSILTLEVGMDILHVELGV